MTLHSFKRPMAAALVSAAAFAALSVSPVSAATIIDEWASVKIPAAPALKPVTVDAKTMAVISMDFNAAACVADKRKRCADSLPAVKKLLDEARAKNVLIIHTLAGTMKASDIAKEAAPVGSEAVLSAGPDKFIGTDLEKTLKDKGITTIITIGTAAHGAVLYTASSATLRGFKAIVPVDGMSSDNAFEELAAVDMFATAPRVSAATTLTKVDMMKF
jgi:nicotinamidase-related amidase